MTAGSPTAQAIAFSLTSVPTALWLLLAQRNIARRGGPSINLVRIIVTIVACAGYLPLVRLLDDLPGVLAGIAPSLLPSHAGYWLTGFVLPSLLLGATVAYMLRRWAPLLMLVGAASVAGGLGLFFESGTHGRWYIQSEGVAYLLTLAVFVVGWHVAGGGAFIYWSRRTRWPRSGFCDACGYDLRGLSANANACPECGGAARQGR